MHKKILLMINFDESNVILVNNYGTNCENIVPRITFFFSTWLQKKSNSYFFSFPFFFLSREDFSSQFKKIIIILSLNYCSSQVWITFTALEYSLLSTLTSNSKKIFCFNLRPSCTCDHPASSDKLGSTLDTKKEKKKKKN